MVKGAQAAQPETVDQCVWLTDASDKDAVYDFTSGVSGKLSLYEYYTGTSALMLLVNRDGVTITSETAMEDVTEDYDLSQVTFEGVPEGVVLSGWATAADGTGTTYAADAVVPVEDCRTDNGLTLYAIWQKLNGIVYHHASGTQKVWLTGDSVTVADTADQSPDAFTVPAFLGWATSADSGEVVYKPGDTITNDSFTDGSLIDLYPVWGEPTATVGKAYYAVIVDKQAYMFAEGTLEGNQLYGVPESFNGYPLPNNGDEWRYSCVAFLDSLNKGVDSDNSLKGTGDTGVLEHGYAYVWYQEKRGEFFTVNFH